MHECSRVEEVIRWANLHQHYPYMHNSFILPMQQAMQSLSVGKANGKVFTRKPQGDGFLVSFLLPSLFVSLLRYVAVIYCNLLPGGTCHFQVPGRYGCVHVSKVPVGVAWWLFRSWDVYIFISTYVVLLC